MGRFCDGCGGDIDTDRGCVEIVVRLAKPSSPAELAAVGQAVLAGAGMPRAREDLDLCWTCFKEGGIQEAVSATVDGPRAPAVFPAAGALTDEEKRELGLLPDTEDLLDPPTPAAPTRSWCCNAGVHLSPIGNVLDGCRIAAACATCKVVFVESEQLQDTRVVQWPARPPGIEIT